MWPFTKKTKAEPPVAPSPQTTPRGLSQADQEMYAEARNAVGWFSDYLGDDAIIGEIRDERVLAAPKSALVNAFRIVLVMEDDEEMREHILQTGLLLSHFQSDIGAHPLRMLPVQSVEGIDPERLSDLIHSHKGEHDRFLAMYPKVQADMHEMAEKYQQSIDAAVLRSLKRAAR
ncbi:hypothetical protein C3Y94_028020 [Rhizobium ruizarguesonis]|uniref:hypothetical protein n=1 Tax=Rhizobium ruizarguesonis TaxID=2081791 RepID=UPI00163AECB3|nr:hypothetical protein [Rhizobium ruizarguesonis]MBC2806981.1 hypothetical protein [Rhizobium ruizarguesonis]